MLVFEETDIAFIKNKLPDDVQEKILNAKTLSDALDAFGEWIDLSYDCWEEDGENYSDLGREAQRVYDNIYLNN